MPHPPFEPLPGFGTIADRRRDTEVRGAIKCSVVFTDGAPPNFDWNELERGHQNDAAFTRFLRSLKGTAFHRKLLKVWPL